MRAIQALLLVVMVLVGEEKLDPTWPKEASQLPALACPKKRSCDDEERENSSLLYVCKRAQKKAGPHKKVWMLDEQMQASKKEARDLEQSLSYALNEYLKSNVYRPGYGQDGDDLESQSRNNTKQLEQEVSSLLDRVSHHIERMESMGSAANQSVAWKAQISRLRDVLNSSTAEFRKTREKIKHREESQELLRNAKAELGGVGLGEQNEEDRLYEQEREGIHSSMRMMDESIGKALALQDTLRLQSNRLRRATAGLSNMAESIPGINQLIKAAGRKKTRDNMIVAAFVAMFVCFTLWWMVNA